MSTSTSIGVALPRGSAVSARLFCGPGGLAWQESLRVSPEHRDRRDASPPAVRLVQGAECPSKSARSHRRIMTAALPTPPRLFLRLIRVEELGEGPSILGADECETAMKRANSEKHDTACAGLHA